MKVFDVFEIHRENGRIHVRKLCKIFKYIKMYPKKKFYRSTRKRKIEEGRQMLLSLGERNNVVNVTIDRRSLRHPRDTAAYHIQPGFACKCGESASLSGSFELLIDRRETIPFRKMIPSIRSRRNRFPLSFKHGILDQESKIYSQI